MKFTAQEEYGLRCLLQLGFAFQNNAGLTIPELSNREGISEHNIAKTLRILRLGGFLESERGRIGGYTLTKPPEEISIGKVMSILGEQFFTPTYCQTNSPTLKICTHSPDCSIRSFWQILQTSIDKVMNSLTLKDLMVGEKDFYELNNNKIEVYIQPNS
jgi:Rrf2 family protein